MKRDEYVERALAAMKVKPEARWTVASLARVAGLSRAPFARRFAASTGASPMRWLTQHRLELAQTQLAREDDQATLAAIAATVGYASEFAFSKAFKRVVGVPPAVYRRIAVAGRFAAPSATPRFRAAA